ncbi:DUF86 domain-containing protein [Spirulina subsalsa FACHB-351]|uniref:DUF86 domain-containing protein n=1 Tax=Spirulina subsalsa FACHB-351 TaxID=234711 RepID=A0ABT3L782_9CYAN|nr:DUF86 domain-containing protein [Spirulina subsalsa]MCW6037372.1 DUF86 domain-containing protein [Spirulina subsalsa FACHB-351]
MLRDIEALIDIQDSIELIYTYVQDIDRKSLENNIEKQDAIVRRLIVIGEATKRLSAQFREQHSEIPWKQIAGMRDIITHDYDEIELEEIWSVIQKDLVTLKNYIKPLIENPPF